MNAKRQGTGTLAILIVAMLVSSVVALAADNPNKPSSPTKLVFIHHSSGGNWLCDLPNDTAGGLGTALRDNNYFVSDTNYGWGPDAIGDRTDIGNWWEWFRGPSSSTYMSALYAESGQNCAYSRIGTDPGGENKVVMFKSCFPNSDLTGSMADPVPAIGDNPLRGNSGPLTVANCRGIYIDLLEYFKTRQDKLFIVIAAPPMQSLGSPASNRAFNNWLANNWLSGYPHKNVFVFDYYNVLTSNGGNADVNDAGSAAGNHHRWWSGAVQHKTDGGGDTLAYPSEGGTNDHPNTAGNQKATSEFVPLLNVAYNRWKTAPPPDNPPPPPPGQWKSTFYFAEGYTGDNFQEYMCLANPNPAAAATWLTAMFTDGTSQTQYYSLAPASRLTVDVNQLVGAGKELSMRVVSTSKDIVAERPMYFNYMGKWSGGHTAVGAIWPATDWYFAEGTTLDGFDEYVTVLNPQTTAANLTFHYMVEGEGEKVVAGKVDAGARATFKSVEQVGANKNVSLRLNSDREVVAERPMYFTYAGLGGHSWTGGHDVLGAPAPRNSASFAEGTTRSGFEEWLCVQNPSDSAITVSARYLLGAGQGDPVEKTYNVPAKQRLTVSVNREIGAEKDVSVELTSEDAFIAERPMYFSYHGAWDGGHDVIGGDPAVKALFAEGYTGANFEEWLCVQNATESAANVTVTYYPEGSAPIEKLHTVAANSRDTINVNDDAGQGLSISAKVESDQPIMVERPMYFNYNGVWTGGHDVKGFSLLI
ncbi:MAG: hypothetical protein CVT63_07520 [Candidatus Anoxymicrobium japonicum]|uniref:Uncharacterized protein n=1 Tax=Candidatus Anoxymicrobium japonicum TaxID=2013648 RepID=A0A2N3G469_9ACTN|nr:MAG: hypothetical protein CVT63_07520 [Candidatus Anoxymicrobium japonicum]